MINKKVEKIDENVAFWELVEFGHFCCLFQYT